MIPFDTFRITANWLQQLTNWLCVLQEDIVWGLGVIILGRYGKDKENHVYRNSMLSNEEQSSADFRRGEYTRTSVCNVVICCVKDTPCAPAHEKMISSSIVFEMYIVVLEFPLNEKCGFNFTVSPCGQQGDFIVCFVLGPSAASYIPS